MVSQTWPGYVHRAGMSMLCFERRILGWPAHIALHRKNTSPCSPTQTLGPLQQWSGGWRGGGIWPPLELVAGFRAVRVVLVFQPQNVRAIGSWRLPH